jgi:hypothetical protein
VFKEALREVWFSVQNGLKQGNAFTALCFNFALELSIRKFKEGWMGLELNGTLQLLGYADDVILMADNIDMIKETQKL